MELLSSVAGALFNACLAERHQELQPEGPDRSILSWRRYQVLQFMTGFEARWTYALTAEVSERTVWGLPQNPCRP